MKILKSSQSNLFKVIINLLQGILFLVNYYVRNIDLADVLSPETKLKCRDSTYDLLANIVHDGEPASGKGTYRVHVLHKVGVSFFTYIRYL